MAHPPTQPDSTQLDKTRPDAHRPHVDIEESRVFQKCSRKHTTKNESGWVRGDSETPGLIITASGAQQVKMQCNHCGHRSSPLPYKLVHAWNIRRVDIGWQKVDEPTEYPPCSVSGCETLPTELHHFAPRNTFADQADLWPVEPLCRPHHIEWHQRMDGYRWQRPGVKDVAA